MCRHGVLGLTVAAVVYGAFAPRARASAPSWYVEALAGAGVDDRDAGTREELPAAPVLDMSAYAETRLRPDLRLTIDLWTLAASDSARNEGNIDARVFYGIALGQSWAATVGVRLAAIRDRSIYGDELRVPGLYVRNSQVAALRAQLSHELGRLLVAAAVGVTGKSVSGTETYAYGGVESALSLRWNVNSLLTLDAAARVDSRRLNGLTKRKIDGAVDPSMKTTPVSLSVAEVEGGVSAKLANELRGSLQVWWRHQNESEGDYYDASFVGLRLVSSYEANDRLAIRGDFGWVQRRYEQRVVTPQDRLDGERALYLNIRSTLWWTTRWGSYAGLRVEQASSLTGAQRQSRYVVTAGGAIRLDGS